MSFISDYATSINSSPMNNAAAKSAISILVSTVSSSADQTRALPLLQLLGEFTAKASQAGL